MKNGKFFAFIILASALILAFTSAFFSITGLSKLFAGAASSIIVMGSAIEIAKLVSVTFLHRFWKKLKISIKIYLTIGAVVISLISSMGIYGFLSSAYASTSGKMSTSQSQISNLDSKKTFIVSQISALNQSKDLKTQRIKLLTGIRTQQETIVDSLYQRRQNASAKRMQQEIEKSGQDIDKLNVESDSIDSKIQRNNIIIETIDTTSSTIQNNSKNGELGPLVYISRLFSVSMDRVANFFIMLLIFVFDPMAISLIIASNIAFENVGKKLETEAEVIKPKKQKFLDYAGEHTRDLERVGNWFFSLFKRKPKPANDFIKLENDKINDSVSDIVNDAAIQPANTSTEIADYMSDTNALPTTKEPAKSLETTHETYVEDLIALPPPPKSKIVYEAQKPVSTPPPTSENPIFATLKIKNSNNFLNFLAVLFEEGKKIAGSKILKYGDFVKNLDANNLQYEKDEIIDFFALTNYFKITSMEDDKRVLMKDYEEAKLMFKAL